MSIGPSPLCLRRWKRHRASRRQNSASRSRGNCSNKILLVWFYTAYVHRLGTYLIELNSGRLRIGAVRYRELMQSAIPSTAKHRNRRSPPAR